MSRKKTAAPEAPKAPPAWSVTAQAARVMGEIAAGDPNIVRAFSGLLGVGDGTIVATDGHRMAWVGKRPTSKMTGTIQAGPWVRAVEAIAPPKRGRGENGRASLELSENGRSLAVSGPNDGAAVFGMESASLFPPVRKVFETALASKDRDRLVRFNASYLNDALSFVLWMGCESVNIEMAGELDPVMVEAVDGSCGMLIMPERQ